jgi:hypothetical protein
VKQYLNPYCIWLGTLVFPLSSPLLNRNVLCMVFLYGILLVFVIMTCKHYVIVAMLKLSLSDKCNVVTVYYYQMVVIGLCMYLLQKDM